MPPVLKKSNNNDENVNVVLFEKEVDSMAGVFSRNLLFNHYCWMGAQDAPYLEIDVLGDDTCFIPEALEFEICMNDWWPSFTAEDEL